MGRKKIEVNPLCGERIKQLCKRKKITQVELANRVGYTSHSISKVATGQIGLSLELAREIAKVFPDVSIEWLQGDPNAKMSKKEALYSRYEDSLKKFDALKELLSYTEYTIDYDNPYAIEGFHDRFYNIIHDDISVAIKDWQLEILLSTIIDLINSLLKYTFESGMTIQQLVSEYSDFGTQYLDDLCDYVVYDADTNMGDEGKRAILSFVRYADKCIGNRSYQRLIHPGQNESDALKKNFEEFQDE